MRLIGKLLQRNTSPARMAGFVLSNFIGLLIVAGAAMFYADARSIWEDEDSFIRKDYMVINKKVTSASTLGDRASTRFSPSELSDLEAQPWVRRTGRFTSSDFRVYASVSTGGRGMETALFFESIPDSFVDAGGSGWRYQEGDREVPIIISKDYLTLYNFGFANSAGMPQLSEQLLSGIPLQLYLRSEDGDRSMRLQGRIVGFSSRLNTVLVPDEFMRLANDSLGSGAAESPSRVIIDVSSPGDVDIRLYLDAHSLEQAGDKSGSQASYLLKVVTGIVMGIGGVITLLSFFILLLSISLLMEKNRGKIFQLLMLGAPLREVGAPYRRMILAGCAAAWALSLGALLAVRGFYLPALQEMGGNGHGWVWALAAGTALTLLVFLFNVIAVRRRVSAAWARKRE